MIDIKAEVKNFSTIKKYDQSMVNLKIQKHSRMASILKLDLIKERWPNRVMEILRKKGGQSVFPDPRVITSEIE